LTRLTARPPTPRLRSSQTGWTIVRARTLPDGLGDCPDRPMVVPLRTPDTGRRPVSAGERRLQRSKRRQLRTAFQSTLLAAARARCSSSSRLSSDTMSVVDPSSRAIRRPCIKPVASVRPAVRYATAAQLATRCRGRNCSISFHRMNPPHRPPHPHAVALDLYADSRPTRPAGPQERAPKTATAIRRTAAIGAATRQNVTTPPTRPTQRASGSK
jgi:hypothetical protein